MSMRQIIKRLCLLTVLMSLCISVYSKYFVVGGLKYQTTSSSTVEVSSNFTNGTGGYSGEVVIPETVEYDGINYNVTSIGISAFEKCSKLTSVTIANSVTSIDRNAFLFCSGLTSVNIPNSVTTIGEGAFSECSSLTSVTIGNSVTSISRNAFLFCSGLTSVTIGNSVTSIEYRAFAYCKGLTSVNIPNNVTSIGQYVFEGCSSLASVTIGNNVTFIGAGAFQSCRGLTSVNIPNSVTSIGDYAFEDCIGLTSATIGNSVTSIGLMAFKKCSSLASVTIGNSVTSIGLRAFEDCSSLTLVTIPNSVTSIGYMAFQYCSSLTSVSIGNSVTSIEGSTFRGCSSLTSVTIGNSVTSIGSGAFSGCSSLTSLTIPNSVTSIGSGAFDGCNSLVMLTLMCSEVGAWFSNNTSIKEVIFGDGVTSIGTNAFSGCISLTSVFIGNSVTSIEGSTFRGCDSLTSVTIGNSVTSIGSGAFSGCSSLTSLTIPNSVTSIGSGAFDGCSSLASLIIGSGVTLIMNDAFSHCDSLSFVTIHCKNIGSDLFRGNTSLKELIIGDEVETIGSSAFSGCSSLKSVSIGNSVTEILGWTFRDCSSLSSLTIGSSVTSIDMEAFQRCSGLTSLTIPNNVKDIRERAFSECSSLASIAIGSGVVTIEGAAFSLCTSLSSLTIPNNVIAVGTNAFSGCTALETLFYNSKDFSTDSFLNCSNLSDITLGEDVETVDLTKNIHTLRCLAKTPPKLRDEHNNHSNGDLYQSSIKLLEVSYGYSAKYAKNEDWQKIPIIYSVNNETKYYPIPINYIGDNVVSINGNIEGYEAKENELVSVEACETINNNPLIMKVTQNISNILSEKGSFSFNTSVYHSDNAIYTYGFPLTSISLSESGTLIDKINMDDILNIENLKISGEINGTDLLVIRKMENLKLLDLKEAHIVNGGMSYYKNYVTSKNKIGNEFFSNNNKLYTVILPQDITEICDRAFHGCYELRTISIPKTVKKMNGSIFSTSGQLNSVHIEDLAAYCSIEFSKYVWMSQMRDMYLNDRKIEDLKIPEGVQSIGGYAFEHLNGLNSLVIPSTVTKIGESAFYCPIKESVICLNTTPPEIKVNTFGKTTYENTTLYVPKGSETLYWLHPYWENFKNIVELDDSGVNDITVDPSPKSKGVYTIDGVKLSANADNIENLRKGIYIINGEKVVIKK